MRFKELRFTSFAKTHVKQLFLFSAFLLDLALQFTQPLPLGVGHPVVEFVGPPRIGCVKAEDPENNPFDAHHLKIKKETKVCFDTK